MGRVLKQRRFRQNNLAAVLFDWNQAESFSLVSLKKFKAISNKLLASEVATRLLPRIQVKSRWEGHGRSSIKPCRGRSASEREEGW